MIHRVTVPALFPPPRYSHASVVEAGTRLANDSRIVAQTVASRRMNTPG